MGINSNNHRKAALSVTKNMKGRMNTNMGDIVIDNEVIAKYAGAEAMECFGVVGMAAVSVKDGIVKLLKKESATRGIVVSVNDNKLSIDFHIIIAYGVSILAVSQALKENVKYKLEEFTGLSVDKINVYVDGVRRID